MGEVVEAGSEVTAVRKGDRVVIPFVIACGDCFFCRLQQYAACESTNSGQERRSIEKAFRHRRRCLAIAICTADPGRPGGICTGPQSQYRTV